MFYTNYLEFDHTMTEHFRFLGRTIAAEAGLPLSWSNSGIEFTFNGDRAEIHFADYECDAPVYVKAFVGHRATRFCLNGKSPKVLLDFERNGTYTVKLLRVSEGAASLYFQKVRVYGKEPKLLGAPAPKSLKLEFMGDSITAGFGDMAVREKNVFETYEQDSSRTYAYLTAEALDAELRTVCISGEGVWHSCGTEPGLRFKNIFRLATRTVEGYDYTTWQPDIMVLNCGTNDVPGQTTPECMKVEGGLLIDQVRAAYPNAEIIWLYGMMNNKFDKPLAELIEEKSKTDPKLHYLYVKDIYGQKNEVGAIGHPNVNASERVSKALVKLIRKEILK